MTLRTSLRRDRTLRRSEGGFKCGRETRLDLAGEFANEDRAIFATERGDGLVYLVPLYENRAFRVDVADVAEVAEEVALDDGFAVGELFGDAAEEQRLWDADFDLRLGWQILRKVSSRFSKEPALAETKHLRARRVTWVAPARPLHVLFLIEA